MPYGYNGSILRVNLSDGSISVEEPGESFYRLYFGGRGFVSYYLLSELRPGTDPLGPENKLIFATGVITGAPVGGTARNSVGAKSPLTGAYGDAEVGGYWGVELKRAGYDAIIIEGKADKPVYLWIEDGKAELREASKLWGKPSWDTQKLIRDELADRDIRTVVIGPAGERLVRYACVLNDVTHAAGRTGLGAVMGSKKLKAIAVRGHKPPEMAQPEEIRALGKWVRDSVTSLHRGLYDEGTARNLFPFNRYGALPTRNFQEGTFEGNSKINGRTLRDTILVARRSCWACPIRCKREVMVKEPYNVNPVYGGPEYETLAALGSNCGIDNLEAIAKAHELCNAYGLDTMSTGVAISFAMECFEKGILTEKDTNGLKLSFGNAEAMLRLIEMIARREGIGDLLAEGVARAANQIGRGAEEYAMHIKGLEIPMHEPRWKHGMGLGYAVSPTGADHCHNFHDNLYTGKSLQMEEIGALGVLEPLPLTDLSPAKVRMFTYRVNWMHLLNCLVFCLHVMLDHHQIVDLVSATTGWNSTVWELMKVGERCATMARAFNIREGFTRADDSLPQRFFTAFASGPLQEVSMDKEKLEQAKETYYEMMGWDRSRGAPTPGKLEELGIGWVAEKLTK